MKPLPKKKTPQEEWREVVGHPDYMISNLGRLWSRPRKGTLGGISTTHNERGYRRITLYRDGKGTNCYIHTLVARAFLGERPEGQEVRHGNGRRADNRAENLSYGTRSENVIDSIEHGTQHMARRTHCKHGHEFTPENTMIPKDRPRRCRKCEHIRGAKTRERVRSEAAA